MTWTAVAQFAVVYDGYVAVADLSQSPQPQVRYVRPTDTQTHRTSEKQQ